MSVFNSSLPYTTIAYHALNSFNLEFETDVRVRSESFGVMVDVLVGEHKGSYDYWADTKSFIAA